ncbi:MAG: primosomal protein N', partial [Methyloligellaceae bacterium]
MLRHPLTIRIDDLAPPETVPVLLPLPLEGPYDYLVPGEMTLAPGDFVVVPLGPQERLGVVWSGALVEGRAPVDSAKLREVIDRYEGPPLPPESLALAEWVATYTVAPAGMVLRMMMSAPSAFTAPKPQIGYRRVGPEPARMTPARNRVLALMEDGLAWPKSALIEVAGVSPGVIDGLVDAGTLAPEVLPPSRLPLPDPAVGSPQLTPEQASAVQALHNALNQKDFSATLLDGVTGSGKTEVYFEAVAAALEAGRQSLILLPEIALTGQFITRFEARFGCPPAEWHSGVSSTVRGQVWRAVASGEARVVVGARSALFLPFPDLGLIIVDEEHDPAFKQEDRVAYQGRDMAVVRASLGQIPIVLCSATPSIESHVNATQGRYGHVHLPERYAGATLPEISAIDLRRTPPPRGQWLSPVLADAVGQTLDDGQQALLFLNRRGYAPLTLCRTCGHRFECPQCSAWLVEHRFRRRLQCHHCGFMTPAPKSCPGCGDDDAIVPCGPGVERIADEVAQRFPDARVSILSSDLVPNITALRQVLEDISAGRSDLIIGTQLVAKGHHFPGLTMVGVVDGDLGLGHGDPRASERTYQLLHQVTGRAGREAVAGRGFIQTYMPEHPVMTALVSGDRDGFLREETEARRLAGYPPFGRLAALIVSGASHALAQAYARRLAACAPAARKIMVLGPAEAPLAIIRGRHRQRLLLKSTREADLSAYIRAWLAAAPQPKGSVRVHIDVDPY